jgi:hypothetical protein
MQLRHSCRKLSFVLIQKKQKIKSQLKKKMGASASLLKLFFPFAHFFLTCDASEAASFGVINWHSCLDFGF